MAPPPDSPGSPTVVRLPANGTTAVAEELRNELVVAAMQGHGTVLDAADVQNVGQAVLQLLIAARREAAASGNSWSIRNAPPEFAARVQGCLLTGTIGLDAGKDE